LDLTTPWRPAGTNPIVTGVAGPACIIQSDFTHGEGDDKHGNFEVVAPAPRGNGTQLRHFFRENAQVSTPWQIGQMITDSCRGWGCLIQSNFGEREHKNFELLVEECTGSIVSYYHPNSHPAWPWLRADSIVGEPPARRLVTTKRIVQLTGEFDRTGWDGIGPKAFAHNRTESAYQIRGTDLGVSFPHHNRTYFLFGDTWRNNQPCNWTNLDLIAYTTDPDPRDGLDLAFFYAPPRVSDDISQREFEVPLDGVSAGASMFVFFSTCHVNAEGYDLMGRSVLTRCDDDGFAFTFLRELSRYKFINVSIQREMIDADIADFLGLPGVTDVLWIWGSGRYRASDVYLAVTPFALLDRGEFDLRYFSGNRRVAAWSRFEEEATALFCNGSVGELSVRWNPHLRRWLATFNSKNPRGIQLHAAEKPWGPWTQRPLCVFDPADGYCTFMHRSWAELHCDHVQDDMFSPGKLRDNDNGGSMGHIRFLTTPRTREMARARSTSPCRPGTRIKSC